MLADHLHCRVASFGNYVRDEALRTGLVAPSRSDLQNLGQQLIEKDARAFCLGVLKSADFVPGDRLVIDGVRHTQVLSILSGLAPGQPIKLIYLHALRNVRAIRNVSGAADLDEIDAHSVESQTTSDMRNLANLILETSGDVRESFLQVLRWIDRECQGLR